MIKYLLVAILIIFPFGQLTRIPTPIPEVTLYPQDFLVLLAVLLFFYQQFKNNCLRNLFEKDKLFYWLFAFFSIGLFSLAVNISNFNSRELIISGLYLLRWFVYVLIYLPVERLSKAWKMKMFKVLLGSLFVSALLGLLQYFFWPDFRAMKALHWDPHYFRLVGSWFDPGFTALIFCLGIFLLLPALEKNKKVFFALFPFLYGSLALTYARSGYLVYLIGISFYSFVKHRKKLFFSLLLLAVLTLVLLPRPPKTEGVKLERKATIWSRLTNYKQSLIIGFDQPLFGGGFNTYRYLQKEYDFLRVDWRRSHSGSGADNSFLLIFATCGILGIIVYAKIILFMVKKLLAEDNQFGFLVLLVFLGVWLHSLINNSLFYPWVMIISSFLWGLRKIKVYS